MVKIYVGNLAAVTTSDELLSLFSQYGKISECDIVKNFGFVYMDDKAQAEEAIRNLHHYELNGSPMTVELSRGGKKSSTKLHVGNIACTNQELRAKFEEFGAVLECDIVKNYAFVHMENMDDALEAINKLDNAAFKGKLMSVKLSTSRLRTAPGMGDRASCYLCGKEGHWSRECHLDKKNGYRNGSGQRSDGFNAPRFAGRGRNSGYNSGFSDEAEYGGGYPPVHSSRGPSYTRDTGFESALRYVVPPAPPPPAPPAPTYSSMPAQDVSRMYSSEASYRSSGSYYDTVPTYPVRQSTYERDPYMDYYERYKAGAYDASYYEQSRPIAVSATPTSAPSGIIRERVPPSSHTSLNLYSVPTIPPPTAPPSSYLTRERSPIRRVPDTDVYAYTRPSVPTVQRSTTYDYPRDPAADRARYGY